ncbi:MerR family transcriptional regulator [Oceanobacillus oncorhynchi subsp. oncorhynchi]|uniref:MerR family transcriptional regulator n=1 Tax=Oceanobacillus oncorhynchi TaxID=545501 RepID=UPI0031D84EEC
MYTVKEAAGILKMSEHTIRYYTDCGLIPSLTRDKNKQRLFNQESMNWLKGIKILKECGMTIKEKKSYVSLSLQGDSTIEERYQIFLHLKEIAYSQLEEAKDRVNFLENKVKHYEDIVSERISDDTNPKKWSGSEEA